MTAKPYAPQSWSDNDPIFVEKLNAMTNNDQYLFEHLPTVYYSANGVRKTAGTKIMASAVSIPASTTLNAMSTFYFGSFFSSGCKPLIIGSANSYPQGRFHLTFRGIGTLVPDHRGFEVRAAADEVNPANNRISAKFWVHFIAVGW